MNSELEGGSLPSTCTACTLLARWGKAPTKDHRPLVPQTLRFTQVSNGEHPAMSPVPGGTDTVDTPWLAEPDGRDGETGPAYQVHPQAPHTCFSPESSLTEETARPRSTCAPHPMPDNDRMHARQAQMPTGGVQVLVWPMGAHGSEWGGPRSPAWRAAVGLSSPGRRWAPGPARGCPPPGAGRSHWALPEGCFLTPGAF